MPCENIKTTSEIENVDWSTGTGSGHHYANVRFGSGSSQASQSSGDICRICHCESDPQNPLLTPCYCAGSLKYVHQTCLQQWLTASETNSCELCKFPFIMHTKIKPFNEWRSLDISGVERRRLCCSLLFHCAAALCVIWSLCVLIERAADDVKRGLIDWPFWTKLAVVTVGLTGGIVFMYIQCKGYLHLCHRWKARNRILLIQNAPEKVHPLSPPSPAGNHRSRHAGGMHEPIRIVNAAGGGMAGNLDMVNNSAAPSNPFNYSNAGNCRGVPETEADGAAALHLLPASPHHLLQQGDLDLDLDLDLDQLAPHSSGHRHHHRHHNHHHHHHHRLHLPHHELELEPDHSNIAGHRTEHDLEQAYHFPAQQQVGQVAVSANIECSQSQHNYERDWALDDVVSQISSFRPCPQGSGSMTPFHDSIHNVLENSENSSRISVNDVCGGSRQDLSTGCVSSDTGREHCLQLSSYSGSEHKVPSIGSGVSSAVANGLGGFVYKPHPKRYSNSSIFIENRDILNDDDAADLSINYRHSSILTPPDNGVQDENLDQFLSKDIRRYSDTKLLDSVANEHSNIRQLLQFQPNLGPDIAIAIDTTNPNPDMGYILPLSHSNSNICQQQRQQHLRRSLDTVESGCEEVLPPGSVRGPEPSQPIDKMRLSFKSLPNLNNSCESLIKK